MNWLRRHPLLGTVLLLGTLALVAETVLLRRARHQATRALAGLAQKQQERDWLTRQTPAPSEANAVAIAQDLALAGEVLAKLRATLHRPAGASPPPAKPIDAYFDLAAFIEKTRALAVQARVGLKPDERFGFASYANEGPEPDLVPAVFRQRLAAQAMVEALLEARPRVLLGVQRERPLAAAPRLPRNEPGAARPAAAGSGVGADYFEWDGPASLRVPGLVESEAFRFEFTGQTAALRAFLGSLAALPGPVIVRRVEVTPLASGAAVPAPGARVPLVAQNFSKFAVVVECVELGSSPERATP